MEHENRQAIIVASCLSYQFDYILGHLKPKRASGKAHGHFCNAVTHLPPPHPPPDDDWANYLKWRLAIQRRIYPLKDYK